MIRKTNIMRTALPYLADLGTVGFVAAAAIIAIGAAAELVSPGLVFNLVAPQGLVAAMIASGALSLLAEKGRRGIGSVALYVAVALSFSGAATFAGWRYFEALPDDRLIITVAIGATTVLIFLAAARASRA